MVRDRRPGVILSLACFALMFLMVSPEQRNQPDLYAHSPIDGRPAPSLELAHIQVVIEAPTRQELACLPRSTMCPLSNTNTWSALRMVLRRWAMTKLVRPDRSCSRAFWMKRSVRVSTLEVASSRMRMRGSARAARAIAINWRCPGSDHCRARPARCGNRLVNAR